MVEIVEFVQAWASDLQRNVAGAFNNMTPEKYIRLIAIVGAYALLRPYIMKLGEKFQTKEHEKEVDPDEMVAAAKISPNSLRGQVKVPEDSEDDEPEAEAHGTGANWGKKARRRQRQMVRKVLEAEENLRREQQEDDEDKDIEEFLTG